MIAWIALSGVIAGGAISRVAPAERLQISTTVLTGTGLSLSGASGHTLTARSPVYLQLEVGFRHNDLRFLEFSPGLLMELEGRIGLGAIAKTRLFLPVRMPLLYGIAAVPVFFVPYSLVGIQGGFGTAVHFHPNVALVGEVAVTGYVWGSDLMPRSALAKLDAQLGLRVAF